jgi:hypothetical protein
MSTIAARMADGAPSGIAVAGFSGQLANRNVDMAEMPKHSLRMFSSLGAVLLFWRTLYTSAGDSPSTTVRISSEIWSMPSISSMCLCNHFNSAGVTTLRRSAAA